MIFNLGFSCRIFSSTALRVQAMLEWNHSRLSSFIYFILPHNNNIITSHVLILPTLVLSIFSTVIIFPNFTRISSKSFAFHVPSCNLTMSPSSFLFWWSSSWFLFSWWWSSFLTVCDLSDIYMDGSATDIDTYTPSFHSNKKTLRE